MCTHVFCSWRQERVFQCNIFSSDQATKQLNNHVKARMAAAFHASTITNCQSFDADDIWQPAWQASWFGRIFIRSQFDAAPTHLHFFLQLDPFLLSFFLSHFKIYFSLFFPVMIALIFSIMWDFFVFISRFFFLFYIHLLFHFHLLNLMFCVLPFIYLLLFFFLLFKIWRSLSGLGNLPPTSVVSFWSQHCIKIKFLLLETRTTQSATYVVITYVY